MLLSSSNNSYFKYFTLEETVELMHEAGFNAIDFGFSSAPYYNEESDNPQFHERLKNLRLLAEEKGMVFNQAHAPFPSQAPDPQDMETRFWDIVRSMKYASILGIPNIVVHPIKYIGDKSHRDPEELFEVNMKFYNRLKPFCEEYNIKVAVENMWRNAYNYKNQAVAIIPSVCASPEDFLRYLNNLDEKWFVACLDTGHAMLTREDLPTMIKALGSRLKCLHVHDIDGQHDSHTVPYCGGMGNWEEIAKALKDANYTGDFTFEAGNFLAPLPKELWLPASRYMADIGNYIIGMIEG